MLQDILSAFPRQPEYLIEILLALQKTKSDHAFSHEELTEVAHHLNIPPSRVSSVVSFYSFFSMTPKGKHVIQVCSDVPCYLNDDFDLCALLQKELGIKIGETTLDQRFTLEKTSCLGCCDMSPAIRVSGKVYGHLTANKVKVLLSELSGDHDD